MRFRWYERAAIFVGSWAIYAATLIPTLVGRWFDGD